MTEQLTTINPDQLPEVTEVPADAFTLLFSPGGPLQKIGSARLLAKLIATNLCIVDQATLYGDLAHDENAVALVFNDPTPLKNGWYRKLGASGGGNWSQFETLALSAKDAATAQAVIAAAQAAISGHKAVLASGFDSIADRDTYSAAATQLAVGDVTTVAGDGNYKVTSLAPITWSRQWDSDGKIASAQAATAVAAGAIATTLAKGRAETFTNIAGSGSIGPSAYAYTTGYTALADARDCGVDFAPGPVDAIRVPITPSPTLAYLRVRVIERLTTAANINASPDQAGDVYVVSNTMIPLWVYYLNWCSLPFERFMARAGYSYFRVMEGFAADKVTTAAIGTQYSAASVGAQRTAGFTKTNAGWANHNTSRRLSFVCATARLTDTITRFRRVDSARIALEEATYRQMVGRNEAQLKADVFAEPVAAGINGRTFGDSMCEQVAASAVRTSTQVIQLLMPGSAWVNTGVGGKKTDEIKAILDARSSAEWAWPQVGNGSTNDETVYAYSVTKANVDALLAEITGPWVFSPSTVAAIHGGHVMSPKQSRLLKELRAQWGARIWNWNQLVRMYEDSDRLIDANTSDTDDDNVITALPDTQHLNSFAASKLGYEQTRMIRAMLGKAPYVHEEVLPLRDNDPIPTIYSNGLTLGTGKDWTIVGGDNSDNAVDLNALTGALGRGAGQNLIGSRELIVRAGNEYGAHENRKTFLAARETTNYLPQHDVEFLGSGYSQCPMLPVADTALSTTPALANTTKIAFFVAMRVTSGMSGSFDANSILTTGTPYAPRILARYASGAVIGTSPTFDIAADPFSIAGYFGSIDTEAGVMTWATNEQSHTAAIPADGALINLSSIMSLFWFAGPTFLKGVALRRFMFWHGASLDWNDPTKRALVYNPATFLPIDIGNTATVDGKQAKIDIFGRPWDWHTGNNLGSMGAFYPPNYHGSRAFSLREITS